MSIIDDLFREHKRLTPEQRRQRQKATHNAISRALANDPRGSIRHALEQRDERERQRVADNIREVKNTTRTIEADQIAVSNIRADQIATGSIRSKIATGSKRPQSPSVGDIYNDLSSGITYAFTGSRWVSLSEDNYTKDIGDKTWQQNSKSEENQKVLQSSKLKEPRRKIDL